MRKNRYIVYITSLFTLAGLLFTSCEDVQDEITELNLSRYLTPLNVKANVIGGTQVRLDWDMNSNAEGYMVEFFANDTDMLFNGNASYTLDGIGETDVPYILLSGLEGNTPYSIRVKATGVTKEDSKWSEGVTITTGGEQLFDNINEDDITYEGVTVKWLAGETVTHLLVSSGNDTPQQINLSASDIQAGRYTITGLNQMTQYTVRLMNGEKPRGELTFTTGVNLGDAIQVNPGDDFAALLADAKEGEIFAFMPGEYALGEISITKSITLLAASAANKPVISTAVKINASISSFNITNVILTGVNPEGSDYGQAIEISADELTIGEINIEGCEISGFTKGFIYNNKYSVVNAFVMDNCLMSDIGAENGGDTFDFRRGPARTLSITNSTFYDFPVARDFIRIDNDGYDTFGGSPAITIAKCTFYNICVGATNKAYIYVRYTSSVAKMENCLIVNAECPLHRSAPATVTTSYSKNAYYDAEKVIDQDAGGLVIDPQFANPANGDFTVTNDNLKYEGIGDPRWLP